MKKEVVLIFLVLVIFLPSTSGNPLTNLFKNPDNENGFSTSQAIIKIIIKEGETAEKTLSVENFKTKKDFELNVVGLDDQVSLSERTFSLNPGEKKEIKITLRPGNLERGIHAGSIMIKSNGKTKYVPLVIEVQSQDIIYVVSLDTGAKYKILGKENEAVTEISLFNIKDVREHEAEIDYKILNSSGENIKKEKETINVKTELKFTKGVNLPKDIANGDYIFAVELRTNNTLSTSSYLFQVSGEKIKNPLNPVDVITTIIAVFLFMIILVTIYILYERKKLISELAKQHKSEIKIYSRGIEKKKLEALAKTKSKSKRKKILEEFKEAKNKIINEIRKEQKSQRKEYGKLKKEKDEKTLKKKMGEWHREIYPKALKRAEINSGLKAKLGVLKHAYNEGLITEDSYKKGSSRLRKKIR